jgi:hypothetical protein
MALSTIKATIYAYPNGNDNTERRQVLMGTLAISASPGTYATGGLSLANVFAVEQNKTSNYNTPMYINIYSVSGSGYGYSYNRASNKLQVFTGSAAQSPATELAAGATPAGVSGDIIEFFVEFSRNA